MQSKRFSLFKVALAGFLAVSGLVLLPGAGLAAPASPPDPATSPAGITEYLQAVTLWLAGGVFIIIGALLLISLIRFQRRPADAPAAEQGQQGSGAIEMIWTLIPMAILVALIVLTYQSLTGA